MDHEWKWIIVVGGGTNLVVWLLFGVTRALGWLPWPLQKRLARPAGSSGTSAVCRALPVSGSGTPDERPGRPRRRCALSLAVR
jgi:hypothetical protein